jgi:transcriptional regulator with XRE-family HTH domain
VGERSKCSPVPQRLKEARERVGLSQRELGIRAGMDPGSASARVNQYERGRHTPDFGTLAAIGHVLNVPVAYFYAVEDGLALWIIRYRADRDSCP